MTMTVSMDIKIKAKQSKHIFTWDFISTGIVLLFRFIVNNFLFINFRFFKKKKLKNIVLSFSQGLKVKIKNWPQFSFSKIKNGSFSIFDVENWIQFSFFSEWKIEFSI